MGVHRQENLILQKNILNSLIHGIIAGKTSSNFSSLLKTILTSRWISNWFSQFHPFEKSRQTFEVHTSAHQRILHRV